MSINTESEVEIEVTNEKAAETAKKISVYVDALIHFLEFPHETEEAKDEELQRLRAISYESKDLRKRFMHMRTLQMTGHTGVNLQESFAAIQ